MGEILPDGTIQGYFGKCKVCGKEIEVNIQGSERGSHDCLKQLQAERDTLMRDLKTCHESKARFGDRIIALEAEHDRLKELIYAKFENLRTDGKTILDFYTCWHSQDRNTISKLKAERDQLKAKVELLSESCRACMYELIDGPTTCKEEIIRIAKAALREVTK